MGEAKEVFSTHQPKGEITLLIEGNTKSTVETPSEGQLENELRNLISSGHSLSTVMTFSHRLYKFLSFLNTCYLFLRLDRKFFGSGNEGIHDN